MGARVFVGQMCRLKSQPVHPLDRTLITLIGVASLAIAISAMSANQPNRSSSRARPGGWHQSQAVQRFS